VYQKTHKCQINTWKNGQYHQSLGKCKLKADCNHQHSERLTIASVEKAEEPLKLSGIAVGMQNCTQLWKTMCSLFTKLNTLTYDPAITPLGLYQGK
jgi:hypothetical protein